MAETQPDTRAVERTGGDALVAQLVREGVTDVFGIPGVQLDWATDALRRAQDKIRYYVPRHEQTTSYMADGYARTTGKVGVCMVVPGPGVLNAAAGLATAYACNSRVLCIAGQIRAHGIGHTYGFLHEIPDQSGVLAGLTKWSGQAKSVEEVPALVRAAMRELDSGRPRPVAIEIPPEVLAARADVATIVPPTDQDGRLKPDGRDIETAAALLDGARFPVIYVGGGVLAANASPELRALAEKLDAPVIASENGRGGLSDHHPLSLNAVGGRAVMPHADVALIVGSRFMNMSTGNVLLPSNRIKYIYLNVDESAWSAPRPSGVTIHRR
jgi:acetolactate synthase-1/2/3 large subunit